ncbi:MAG: T9SS type A sorting domain-containing protein, partial [Bacteroidota bacterium]|nr:T9SS type A sorting domain-containing protein [Bacteroidota bacterium]
KIVYTAIGEPNLAGAAGPITGPSEVCTSNSTFTLHNRPPGTTVNWTKDFGLIYVSGQGTDNYTVRAVSNDYKTISAVKATITGNCGQRELTKNTWVGRPGLPVTTPDGDPPMEVLYGRSYLVRLFHPPGAEALTGVWSANGSITIRSGNTGSSIVFKVTGWDYGQWKVNTSNSCGISDTYTGAVYMPGWKFSMYPNPADDYIEITAEKKEYDTKGLVSDSYEVKIYSILKSLVYESAKTDQPLLRISTKQFLNGTYFVHFTAGEQKEVKQLIINH